MTIADKSLIREDISQRKKRKRNRKKNEIHNIIVSFQTPNVKQVTKTIKEPIARQKHLKPSTDDGVITSPSRSRKKTSKQSFFEKRRSKTVQQRKQSGEQLKLVEGKV